MKTSISALLAVMLCAGPAAAHDFWIQPRAFRVDVGTAASATLQVGHGPLRQRSPIPAERIVTLVSVGPDGVVDQRSGLRLGEAEEDMTLRFPAPGTYVVALETNGAFSNLPAIRFNDYLQAEGLTPAIAWRERTGTGDDPGRELYSRRAKAVMEVGPGGCAAAPQVTEALGLTLEIVPDRDPCLVPPAGPLPVHVLYQGRPLAGATVKLTDLDADDHPVETHVTDEVGQASFTVPREGSWLLNVIWTEPVYANRMADYVTTFSSLSFGISDGAR